MGGGFGGAHIGAFGGRPMAGFSGERFGGDRGRFRIGDGRGFRDHTFHRDRHFFDGFGPGYAYYDNDCYYYGQYYRWQPYCGY